MKPDAEIVYWRIAMKKMEIGNRYLEKGNRHIKDALEIIEMINEKNKRPKLTVVR